MNKLTCIFPLVTGALVADIAHSTTEIPPVMVSAARTEQSNLSTPASIHIINRQQITASGATHVVEILRGQGGVQVNDLYGEGSRVSIGMRGFNESAGSNTLVLVDGRRLNNPDIAAPDLNSISLDDVERIEIVQGSAGVLFGDQAVGGVINIITAKPAELQHSVKLSAGSYDTVMFHGVTSQALDNGINYRVSLDARESDNYRQHNESSYLNGFGRLGYDYATGNVFADVQYVDDELNAPGTLFDDELAADRRQVNSNFATDFSDAKTRSGRVGLVQEISDNLSFEGELTHREVDGTFRLSSVFGAESQDSSQQRSISEITPRLIGFLPQFNNAMITLGADIIDSDYHLSSRFGDQINEQDQESVYVQLQIPASGQLDITLGVRHAEVKNNLRDTGMFAIYPAGVNIDDDVNVGTLGLSYRMDSNWRLLLRADQNYRFAKVDEYLQPAYTPTFTPIILETQEGVSVEAGFEWTGENSNASLMIYQLDLENEIAFDPINFANINLDDTERQGVITSGSWQLTKQLNLSASYTYTDASVKNGAFSGKDIPFVAEHSGLLGMDYSITSHWNVYGEIIAISDRVFSGDFNNVLDRLPGYAVMNLKAGYQQDDFDIMLRIHNLLDKQYSDVGQLGMDPNTFASRAAYFPSPEMNFLVTAQWYFR